MRVISSRGSDCLWDDPGRSQDRSENERSISQSSRSIQVSSPVESDDLRDRSIDEIESRAGDLLVHVTLSLYAPTTYVESKNFQIFSRPKLLQANDLEQFSKIFSRSLDISPDRGRMIETRQRERDQKGDRPTLTRIKTTGWTPGTLTGLRSLTTRWETERRAPGSQGPEYHDTGEPEDPMQAGQGEDESPCSSHTGTPYKPKPAHRGRSYGPNLP